MASKNISFDTIPDGIKETGVYIEQNVSAALRASASVVRKGLILAQRLKARIEPRIFQGGTLNDLTSGGAYTALVPKKFRVKITTAAATDKFKWSADEGLTWSNEVSVTGAAQALSDGVTVTFGAATGHALADEWRFNAYSEPTVAQKLAYQIYSSDEADLKVGAGSPASLMAAAAIKKNPGIDLTLVTLDDAAGVAASGTSTFTGAAGAAGTLRRFFGHQYVDVPIAKDDTPAIVAINVANAVAAKLSLPVTASNLAGVVTYAAKNKGVCGNDIHLAYVLTGAEGLGIADVAMANGATDPDIQDALDVVTGMRYHVICSQWNDQDSIDALEAHADMMSAYNNLMGCVGLFASVGSLGSATTLSQNTNGLRAYQYAYCRYTAATKKQDPSYILAAISLGAETLRKPTQPAKNVDMTGISVPDVADRLSYTERRTCFAAGVSPVMIAPGEKPVLPRVPATYCLNAAGQAVFIDIHKVTGWDYHRDAVIADLTAFAPNQILEKDENHPLGTLDVITNIVKGTAYRLQESGDLTGVKSFEAYFLAEKDLDNVGQVNVLMPSPVPDGLYVLAVKQVAL